MGCSISEIQVVDPGEGDQGGGEKFDVSFVQFVVNVRQCGEGLAEDVFHQGIVAVSEEMLKDVIKKVI